MPATQSNPLARTALTLIIIGAAIGLTVFLFNARNANLPTKNSSTPTDAQAQAEGATPDDATAPATIAGTIEPEPEPVADSNPAPSPSTSTPDATTETTPPPAPPVTTGALAVRVVDGAPPTTPLGSLDPASGFRSRVEFTLAGAGVSSITLSDYYETIQDASLARHSNQAATGHYQLQKEASAGGSSLVSLGANAINVNGQTIELFSQGGKPVWREAGPGVFVAEIIDTTTNAVALRITRAYTLAQGSFTLDVRQRIENLTGAPVSITWYQFGPVDLNEDPNANNTPTRRIRYGYLLEPSVDPSRSVVRADTQLTDHNKVLRSIEKALGAPQLLWPQPSKFKNADALSWVAQTSRYFAFAIHPLIAEDAAAAALKSPSTTPLDRALPLAAQVYAQVIGTGPDAHIALEIVSPQHIINPSASLDLDFSAYAGPLTREYLAPKSDPVGRALSLGDMVVFQIGMCGFCSFQPIARVLLDTLRFFHDYLVRDWGLAIILLVVLIRTILHPVFKRSQVSMMRFSRQMQRLAPKQKALQAKYKDDPKKLREEQVRLMKEENVNYAGMLGCIPMFLQTPIWIALYAMLFFAFDLRQEPAFFGIFQKLTGSNWLFLADLSRPDGFIPLPFSVNIPILGETNAINILPLILGVVFFLHQKIITPPATTQLSPEQEQAQKMAKWMMVGMFPLFMYNRPAGLCLYFVTNSCLAIIEGKYIRKHTDALDLDAPPKPRAPLGRKPVANTAANPFRKGLRDTKHFKDRE